MARKKRHEEHENHERWLVSYADFITLLFAFFVVMYAVSSVNEGKFRVLAESMIAAFKSPSRSLSPIQVGSLVRSPLNVTPHTLTSPQLVMPMVLPMTRPSIRIDNPIYDDDGESAGQGRSGLPRDLKKVAMSIEQALGPLIDQEKIRLRTSRHSVEIEINETILFDSGSARLDGRATPVLEAVAEIIGEVDNPIEVEGFTDNRPIETVAFPSNWELSAARAASVVHLFKRLGVEPERMAAIGYGEYHPVAPNDTVEGRARNRRVVLVLLAQGHGQSPSDRRAESRSERRAEAERRAEGVDGAAAGTGERDSQRDDQTAASGEG